MPQQQENACAIVNTPVGMMRPATSSEITAWLRQHEWQAGWEAVHDFAQQLFGERAHHAQVVTGDEYDDEHYYTVVEDVIVYDAEGNPLPYDLTLPYWTEVGPDHFANATSLLQDFENWLKQEEAERKAPFSAEEREQLLQEYAHDYVRDHNLYANEFDLPCEDATFALAEPPPERAGPVLYILLQEETKQRSDG